MNVQKWLYTAAMAAVMAATSGAGPALAAAFWPDDKLFVSAEWLKGHAAGNDLVLLHMGPPDAYPSSHIEGARLVRLDMFAHKDPSPDALTLELPTADELRASLEQLGISDGTKVVIYFNGATIPAATRVIFTFQAAGLGDRIRLLDGGLDAWRNAGYPVTDLAPTVVAGKLSPFQMHAPAVDAAFVQSHLNSSGYKVVDARAPDFYAGVQVGGSADKPHLKGHIAGAVSLPFSSITGADQKLKSAAEIAAAFKAAGVKPGDKAIVYCHIGQQASAVAFAARAVGIEALLYDGSFQDWSRRNLPVETAAK